jgi:tetratricopeptide (TPR) repeat protein
MRTDTRGDLPTTQSGRLNFEEAMQRGIAASEAGDQATAYSIFQRLADQYPDMFEVWVWLGWTSPTLDDSEAAFSLARELDPGNEEAALGLRWVASQREPATEQEEAVPFVPPVDEAPPVPAPVVAQQPVQQPVQVQQPVPQTAPPQPESLDDLLKSGMSAAQAGYKMAAYATFQEAVSEYPGEVEAWVWLGGTSPSLDEAELAFKRACELDPGNEEAAVGLRWVALRRRVVAESSHVQNGNGVRPAEFVGASVAAGAPEAPWEPEQKQAKPSFFSRLFGKKG